jgi:DNA replication protein DnaC
MMPPYQFCESCIAAPFCNAYSGKVPLRPDAPVSWCNAQYRLYKALELSRIPKVYLTANIHNFKVDEDNKIAFYNDIEPAVEGIVAVVDRGTNFLIFNQGTGTGKTYAGATLLNHFIYKTCTGRRFDFELPLGMFVEFATIIDDLRYRREDADVVETMQQMRDTPFLMLDDVGAGTLSDFALEQTYLLLNYRVNNGLATLYTSNFGLEQLKKTMGSRIFSRMLMNAMPIELGGKDRRLFG